MPRMSAFNLAAIVLGIGFLYLPIVVLVIYSFNDLRPGLGLGRLVATLVRQNSRATRH